MKTLWNVRCRFVLMTATVCLHFSTPDCLAQSGEPTFFPPGGQFVNAQTGRPMVTPNSRQLTDPSSGASTFNGFDRQLTDPTTGRSTFNGYTMKLTDPVSGAPTFKGYGQNPLMQDRASAPDFHWASNVDSQGRSQYTGFGRDPLATAEGSTFIGNNRSLATPEGRKNFVEQYNSFSAPHLPINQPAFENQGSTASTQQIAPQPVQSQESVAAQVQNRVPEMPSATATRQQTNLPNASDSGF